MVHDLFSASVLVYARFKKLQQQTITNERNEEKVQEFFCAAKQKLSLDKIRKKDKKKKIYKKKKRKKKDVCDRD